MKRYLLFFSLLIINYSLLIGIEVGGHLTEDTTWSPENNPYLVTENLYVDSGVTLTILPGTVIKISGAICTSGYDFDQNFWYQNGNNVAKMFWVDGKIIAEGTEQDSIVFSRLQNDFDFYWGCIYIPEGGVNNLENMSILKHCKFEYSAGIGIVVGYVARGAVSTRTGYGYINNCTFYNNGKAISSVTRTKGIEVSGSMFYTDENINNYVYDVWGCRHLSISRPEENFKPVLLSNNTLLNNHIGVSSVYYVNNKYINCHHIQTGICLYNCQ